MQCDSYQMCDVLVVAQRQSRATTFIFPNVYLLLCSSSIREKNETAWIIGTDLWLERRHSSDAGWNHRWKVPWRHTYGCGNQSVPQRWLLFHKKAAPGSTHRSDKWPGAAL